MKTAVFTLELTADEDLPEDFIDDVGSYLGEGVEYYFDEFGSPIDVTVQFFLKSEDKPRITH